MPGKSLLFVVCTMLNESDFQVKSETCKFFQDNQLKPDVDYVVHYQNTTGLSARYNRYLQSQNVDKIVVFVHDDVILNLSIAALRRELNAAHKRFDVVGLAGATRTSLSRPTLWHIMQKGASGSVGHAINGLFQMTHYGPTPAQCITVDGLFISVNVDSILKKEHKFDEQFNFHHYDIDFCIQADKKGLKIGTWPIWVTHLSPGLTSLEKADWKKSDELFCKKYQIQ